MSFLKKLLQGLGGPSHVADVETSVDLAKHEVLLSFNNKEDVVIFSEWWYLKGWEKFSQVHCDLYEDEG